ncbi:MAG: fumarate hydratase [Planctomycetota bacterium]|nr:fumarate hydratase [Planctomycetota bacterium]
MRDIDAVRIVEAVEKLCLKAAFELPGDVYAALARGTRTEKNKRGRNILKILCENARIAKAESLPICQDTGVAVVFVELGEDARVVGSVPYSGASAPAGAKPRGQSRLVVAINEGVRRGYRKGYLRKSVVADPIIRKNTGDNTPAVIHVSIVPGDGLRLVVAPKGFGSENMSRLKMFEPTAGSDTVKDFVVETVTLAGGNPCPPIIVGVGIGGTMEVAALLAKRALLRKVGLNNLAPHLASLEREMLAAVNMTGVGPEGLGGNLTAIAVNVEAAPTHIAGLPVAVNICCHAARHAEKRL